MVSSLAPLSVLELTLLDHQQSRRVPLGHCSVSVVVLEVHSLLSGVLY